MAVLKGSEGYPIWRMKGLLLNLPPRIPKTLTKNQKQWPKELSLNVYSVTNVVFKMRVSQ